MSVGAGVTARWTKRNEDGVGAGEAETDRDASVGRMEWMCEVGAGTSVDLMLAWEVSAPVGMLLETQ